MSRPSTFAASVLPGDRGGTTASRRGALAAAAVLWLAAGLSVGYWLLRAAGQSPLAPLAAPVSAPAAPDTATLARALGAVSSEALSPGTAVAAAPLSSRFRLIGVVASGQGGAALIAVDGQPARPYRVGAALEGDLVLQAVNRRSVRLAPRTGDAAQAFELTLPEPPASPS